MKRKPQNHDQNPGVVQQKPNKKEKQTFSCACGKSYGSLAAVHTHINNKHNGTEEEKKIYKANIHNPRKSGNGPSTSIRMKDIKFNKKESQLMVLSDTTLKEIFDYHKELNEASDILLNQAEDDFEDDSDLESNYDSSEGHKQDRPENEEAAKEEQKPPKVESARTQRIKARVEVLKTELKVPNLDECLQYPEMNSYNFSKFKLQMVKELTKFFKEDFASKINLTLHIQVVLQGDYSQEERDVLEAIPQKIWFQCPRMTEILSQYHQNWVEKLRE